MKSKNKIKVSSQGWSVQQLTQWPISASYHHCGWCTSEDKGEFDHYTNSGELYVVFKPNDRPTRPSYQLYLSKQGSTEIMSKGNRNRSFDDLIEDAPPRVADWLSMTRDEADKIASKRGLHSSSAGTARVFSGLIMYDGDIPSPISILNPPISEGSHTRNISINADTPERVNQDIKTVLSSANLNESQVFDIELSSWHPVMGVGNRVFGSLDEFNIGYVDHKVGSMFTIRNLTASSGEKIDVEFLVTNSSVKYLADDAFPVLQMTFRTLSRFL